MGYRVFRLKSLVSAEQRCKTTIVFFFLSSDPPDACDFCRDGGCTVPRPVLWIGWSTTAGREGQFVVRWRSSHWWPGFRPIIGNNLGTNTSITIQCKFAFFWISHGIFCFRVRSSQRSGPRPSRDPLASTSSPWWFPSYVPAIDFCREPDRSEILVLHP